MKPLQALQHPFFDELRNPKCRINNKQLDNLFNFTEGKFIERLVGRGIDEWIITTKKLYS